MLQQDCLSDLEENVCFENFHAGQLQILDSAREANEQEKPSDGDYPDDRPARH